ncbi:MAG: Do family serine endopeptidase [Saprospiraceae bacterium]
MKKYLLLAVVAMCGGLVALTGAHMLGWDRPTAGWVYEKSPQVHFANYKPGSGPAVADFTYAAEKSLPVVVHIAATVRVKRGNARGFEFQDLPEPFRDFFGPGNAPFNGHGDSSPEVEQGSGSGVILSSDGYIVTNNHVVREAEDLTVTLNDQRTFKARVIGTDPSTDLALIKIDASELPFAHLADSDHLKVGEWVVAVGNPFNLSGTVTAGIVSAKGRDIHIVQDKAPIESFIQTDAVVNPGNSGGALVNLNGDLIGINTAIASPTGVYAGYAFAIPSNLAAKVVDDLRQYGVVQRGYLGIIIRDQPKSQSDNWKPGIYVDSLAENSAAAAAGVKTGDQITKVDGMAVTTSPELLEIVGKHRPGDQLALTVMRGQAEKTIRVTLKNREGNTDVVKKPAESAGLASLGAEFRTLDAQEARRLGIRGGVKITGLTAGKLASQTGVRTGFIITKVNKQPVDNVDALSEILGKATGGVMLEGIYPDNAGEVYYYAFGL